jgi:hypothetical protein
MKTSRHPTNKQGPKLKGSTTVPSSLEQGRITIVQQSSNQKDFGVDQRKTITKREPEGNKVRAQTSKEVAPRAPQAWGQERVENFSELVE